MSGRTEFWWARVGAWLAPVLMGLALPALGQGGGGLAAPAAPNAPYDIRWEVERAVRLPQGGVRTEARFVIEPTGTARLPASGWSLYFTCLAEADEGPSRGPFVVERIKGTLYRLRPTAAFTGAADGAPLHLGLVHGGTMTLTDRAPQGVYLVFDDEPGRGLAPQRYRVMAPELPAQLALTEDAPLPWPSATAQYERHAVAQLAAGEELPPVFPTPRHLRLGAGRLHWQRLPLIDAPAALAVQAAQVRARLRPFFGPPTRSAGTPPPLRLSLGRIDGETSPEAYELRIDARQGVSLRGASAAGVARGLQSLLGLLPLQATPAQGVALPVLSVRDAPRFEHRGLLLDVARHFHPKDTVMRVIDVMARLKLNVLHLHLTDDEGWRLAIPGLPELTEIGGRRGHSVDGAQALPPAHGSGPDAARSSGSGFYSADDYVQILRHAAARQVQVLPEIEMPGHARAAVQAMRQRTQRLATASSPGSPEATRYALSDPADTSRYRSAQLHDDHLMDPGLESTYTFIDTVFAELAALHRRAGIPLQQVHAGADELPAGAWAGSPAAQATIAREGLAGLPGLWNRFYDRVAAIAQRHGARLAGWEELGSRRARADGSGPLVPNEHFAGRDFTLYVWNNLDEADDLAYRLANAGYRTVLAPATRLYLDMAASLQPGEPGVNWAALVDLKDSFDFVPLDALRRSPTQPGTPAGKAALTAEGAARIAGIEATLFGEVMPTRERLETLMLPRLFALAERAWAADPAWASERDEAQAAALHARDWSRFVQQVGARLLRALQRDWPDLAYRIPPPGLKREGDAVLVNAAWPGLVVRYTLDGRDPDADSPLAGARIHAPGAVRAAAFDARGRRGLVSTLPAR